MLAFTKPILYMAQGFYSGINICVITASRLLQFYITSALLDIPVISNFFNEFIVMLSDNMKFLVVDDSSGLQEQIKNLLKEIGFLNVDKAEDGAVALQKLRAGNFDVILPVKYSL